VSKIDFFSFFLDTMFLRGRYKLELTKGDKENDNVMEKGLEQQKIIHDVSGNATHAFPTSQPSPARWLDVMELWGTCIPAIDGKASAVLRAGAMPMPSVDAAHGGEI
jgi:hypothetical protein